MLDFVLVLTVIGSAVVGLFVIGFLLCNLLAAVWQYLTRKPELAQEGAPDLHIFTPGVQGPHRMPKMLVSIPKADSWQWLCTGFPLSFDDAWHDEDYFAMKRLLERADHALFCAWIAATGKRQESEGL